MARIIAVCTSKKKRTSKQDIGTGQIDQNYGLVGDAHADGQTHRQVSLMAIESIDKMKKLGFDVGPGVFAENLTTEGIEMVNLPVGTELAIGEEVILEITQIGKDCHTKCAIYHQLGQCIMPQEGIFARVIKGGEVKTEDRIKVKENGQ